MMIFLKRKLRVVLFLALVTLLSGLSMRVDGATTSYTYDSLNRLIRAIYADGTVINYTYDNAGNRLSETASPPAPVAHTATNVISTGFTANWSSVTGATGYKLDVSTSSSFTIYVSGYQNLDVGNALTKIVSGLNAGTTYYYRIRAFNSTGTSANSNVISVTTL